MAVVGQELIVNLPDTGKPLKVRDGPSFNANDLGTLTDGKVKVLEVFEGKSCQWVKHDGLPSSEGWSIVSRAGHTWLELEGGDDSDIVVFPQKQYDVTNCGLQYCACGSQTLVCGPEEVNLQTTTCCSEENKRFPYADLGSVDVVQSCGCCAAFGGPNMNSQDGQPIAPGCGCDNELVEEIVALLKERQRERGSTAQLKRAEQQAQRMQQFVRKVDDVEGKMNVLMKHFGLSMPTSETMSLNDDDEES